MSLRPQRASSQSWPQGRRDPRGHSSTIRHNSERLQHRTEETERGRRYAEMHISSSSWRGRLRSFTVASNPPGAGATPHPALPEHGLVARIIEAFVGTTSPAFYRRIAPWLPCVRIPRVGSKAAPLAWPVTRTSARLTLMMRSPGAPAIPKARSSAKRLPVESTLKEGGRWVGGRLSAEYCRQPEPPRRLSCRLSYAEALLCAGTPQVGRVGLFELRPNRSASSPDFIGCKFAAACRK
jgi:hypothetical protein